MRKIADAVEYSPTAIYAHFADKEALMREICHEDFGALAAVFLEIAECPDPVERIRQIGMAYGRFGLEHPSQYRLMFMTLRQRMEPTEKDLSVRGNPDEDGYAFLRQNVAQAVVAGRFGLCSDPELIAQTFWAAVHGVVSLQIAKANDFWVQFCPFEDRIKLMVDGIIAGLSGEAHAPKATKEGAR
ncbi:MAG: TetR/AcrR family transcriptional regulator [Planctomycetota bacterium]|nr:TetR/AcrR family transcriptional regulator [Planctomycetota bacterium]